MVSRGQELIACFFACVSVVRVIKGTDKYSGDTYCLSVMKELLISDLRQQPSELTPFRINILFTSLTNQDILEKSCEKWCCVRHNTYRVPLEISRSVWWTLCGLCVIQHSQHLVIQTVRLLRQKHKVVLTKWGSRRL